MSKNIDDSNKNEVLQGLILGKKTDYASSYDPDLLSPVPRSLGREEVGISSNLPFYGYDVWNAYEISWLNVKGKPQVALARFTIPHDTANIIESKSLKLYLNSFNQSAFESEQKVLQIIKKDLSEIAKGQVNVELYKPDNLSPFKLTKMPGKCIDHHDVDIQEYELNPELLAANSSVQVSEILHSHLLKSNCLITNQPDWASIVIEYEGNKIDQVSLLKYLVSFRQHNEFHEQCVERIYIDLMEKCELEQLSVLALYTRRGGLDINPFRSSKRKQSLPALRNNRQ